MLFQFQFMLSVIGWRKKMTEYKDMTTEDLWKEITYLIQATHFIEADKELFMKAIQEYSYRGNGK